MKQTLNKYLKIQVCFFELCMINILNVLLSEIKTCYNTLDEVLKLPIYTYFVILLKIYLGVISDK